VTQPTPRLIRCRYLGRNENRCTNEAADPEGEILLCQHHLSRAIELIGRRLYQWASN
jgi:hypothetical protein